MSYDKIKRIIDFSLSLICLVLLLPFLLLISIAVKLDSKGPILFKQKRFGKDKTFFYLLKFRSMRINTPNDVPTHLFVKPENFITIIGKILRKTSMDELPQLWNILLGDISIIGPRPALWNQYDLIDLRDKYGVNDYRPGLTGLAQINGRDELPIDTKARLDGAYVQGLSFSVDVKCFFGTIIKVLRCDDIVEGNNQIKSYKKTTTKKRSFDKPLEG